VYWPDRRGRGLSGPVGEGYRLQTEVADLEAFLAKTGTDLVFGVSSGAVICLQAAFTMPAIRKAASFEPPLLMGSSTSTAYLARLDQEIARGKMAAALMTGMKATQMGPPVLRIVPRWLLEALTGAAMSS
jgi:pimeloyl-ACP methyl ester carboxylesterase